MVETLEGGFDVVVVDTLLHQTGSDEIVYVDAPASLHVYRLEYALDLDKRDNPPP